MSNPYSSPKTQAEPAETFPCGKYLTSPLPSNRIPGGIPYIVGNEAAERFSFYGMKAILTIFMTKYLLDSHGNPAGMAEEQAKYWIHNFNTYVYFFPLLGAIVSDWLLGKYRTILSLSIVYCAGHAVLASLDTRLVELVEPRTILFCGLALISVGAGGIKPCVSAHVGDQFGPTNGHLLPRVFAWFYFSINLGSTISTLLTPLLLHYWGPGWAFGVPGILMSLATFVFWLGRHKFVHIPPAGTSFFSRTFSRIGLRTMLNLIPLYVLIAPFWALFDQTATSWVLQAEKMDRVVSLGNFFTWNVLSSQLQAVNPVLVMLFIPLFSYVIYPIASRYFEITPLRKIAAGLFITVIAFAIPAWLESRIAAGGTPHIVWHIVAYIFITAAEILVSITALEFSYTQAPKEMKSFIMSLFLLSIALGNQFVAIVNWYIQTGDGTTKLPGASYYWFFTAVVLLAACLFTVWARFYRGRTYIQGDLSD